MVDTNRISAKISYCSTLTWLNPLARCASLYFENWCFNFDCSPSYLSIQGFQRVTPPPVVGLLQNLFCFLLKCYRITLDKMLYTCILRSSTLGEIHDLMILCKLCVCVFVCVWLCQLLCVLIGKSCLWNK